MRAKAYKPKNVSDCVACILRPFLSVGSVVGISCFNVKCWHNQNLNYSSNFESSFLLSFISSILCLPPFTYLIFLILQLSFYDLNLSKIVETVLQIFYFTGAMSFWIFGILKRSDRILELNALARIVEFRRFYGINCFLSSKTTKAYTSKMYIANILLIIINFFFTLDFISYGRSLFFDVYIFSSVALTTCSQTIAIYQLFFATCLYRTFYKKCFIKIVQILEHKLEAKSFRISDLSFEIQLSRLTRLYMGITYNYKQMVTFWSFTVMVWCTAMLGILIWTCYIVLVSYLAQQPVNYLLLVKFIGTVMGLIQFFYSYRLVNNVSDELLPYMFQYPVSKLTSEEAAQLLLLTINIQKPELRPSEMFTVGTGMLSSITGTVVTYLLVALQFHATWTKP